MPKVFQIAYSPELMFTREAVLKSRGYRVESVLGNEAARKALEAGDHYDLFIFGHAEPLKARQEMVRWVREKFPNAKVLALNPPHVSPEPEANYNVTFDRPEEWLAVIQEAVG
jgi:hypothetical protein